MGRRAGIVCLWLCGSVTTITWNCVHRSSPNWVCRYYLQLIKFWPSCASGKGVCGGVQISGSALLQIARSMCISLSTFFIEDGMVTWQQNIILAFKHSMIDFLSVFIHFNLIYKMTHHMCWVDITPRSLTAMQFMNEVSGIFSKCGTSTKKLTNFHILNCQQQHKTWTVWQQSS